MVSSENLVISPVYNEEEFLREFYRRLRSNYKDDVLFVDDGSEDESRIFLKSIRARNTFLITHPQRRGYGRALISGFRFALEKGYKRIVTIDVDMQHRPERIPQFFRELLEWEVVLGSRYIKIDRFLAAPRQRLIINRYISSLIRVVFSTKFSDPFCGFRGYRDTFLRRIEFKEESYGLSLEILLEIIKTGTIFKEVPVEAIYFKDSRRFLDGLDDPRTRLLYYSEIISRKRREIQNRKETISQV